MYTKITYIGTLDGVKGMWCGFKPDGIEVTEERTVLYADEGKSLVDKDGNKESAVWLKDTTEKDYTEELEESSDANIDKN